MSTLETLFASRPKLAVQLYLLASEIVDDFEDYGPVIQANEVSEYDKDTTIVRLRELRNQIVEELRSPLPFGTG
jgi:hypothetical protein